MEKSKYNFALFICLALNFSWASGQNDSVKIIQLLDKAYGFEQSDPNMALKIYRVAYRMSVDDKYYLGAFKALQYSGIVQSDNGRYDSAFYYYEISKPWYIKAKYPRGEAQTYINIGNTHQFIGNYNNAVSYYLKGIKIFETIKDSMRLSQSYQNLSALYGTLKNPELEIFYLKKAVQYSNPKNLKQIAGLYGDLGLTLLGQKKPAEALTYFKKTDAISDKLGDKNVTFIAKRNIGDYYSYIKRYQEAISFYETSLRIGEPSAIEKNDLMYIMSGLYFEMGNYERALYYSEQSVALSKQIQTREILYKSYRRLAEIYNITNNRDKAYDYLVQSVNLKDSVMHENYLKQISLIQTQYESEKKDKAIAEQQSALKRSEVRLLKKQNQATYSLIAVILLALTSVGIWLFFRQRQRLKNKEILALEQQKEIALLGALIDGEEKERRRIAQELHDGINGDLSAIKFRLSAMEDTMPISEDRENLVKTIEMIDHSCTQVRTISHNLMPASIVDFGLVETVRQYCTKINNSHPVELDFQYFGNPPVLAQHAETAIYRIIQELINNIIRHSEASQALVQMNFHENELSITVEDNGKGFDIASVSSGIGLKNINTRIQFLNAQIDGKSDSNGTSFHININTNSL